MDRTTVRQAERLTALKTALANRRITTRLDVLPVPFLVIPVLHLSGQRVMVHVVLGRAGPDFYVWDHGQHRHLATDPTGAAEQVGTYLRHLGREA